MKRIFLLALLLPLLPVVARGSDGNARIDDLDWLTGCWAQRTGRLVYEEHWMRPAAGVMLGMSRTIVNGRVAGTEWLRIDVSGTGRLQYIAIPSAQALTVFPLAALETDYAVFENPDHDFPQRIIYARNGDRLEARIEGMSNGELKRIDFPMQREACN